MAVTALLTRDVERRVAPVLALLDARAWPNDELNTLIGFLRGPGAAAHDGLAPVITQLERAYANPCPLPELRRIVASLVASLADAPAGEPAGRPAR